MYRNLKRRINKLIHLRVSLLFIICCTFFLNHLSAKNYYFSNSTGNDTYTNIQAQNSTTPWKSITKLNAVFNTLIAGDSILFKRGEVFYGSITVNSSGASNRHIVLGAYGIGTNPVISGFTTISSWTPVGAGVYQAPATTAAASLNMVTLNNQPQQIGRYPNTNAANGGYLTYNSFNDTLSITDSNLTSTTNWTGAEVVIRKKLWVLDRCKITNHSGSILYYSNTGGSTYDCSGNFGYFIQNDVRTLDQFGEWYFDVPKKILKVYFGNAVPSAYVIKASGIDILVNINAKKYITFNNLSFEGANNYGIYSEASDFVTVQNCSFTNIGGTGIYMQSVSDVLIENTTCYNNLSNAIRMASGADSNVTIRNCSINKTGAIRGMAPSGGNSYKAIIADLRNNSLMEYNKVDTTGYVAIEFGGSNATVKNNLVNYFCYNKDDGGGIYSWAPGTDAEPAGTFTNRVVRDNIVMNGIGAPEGRSSTNLFVSGIYLDGRMMNVDVINNTVFNIGKNGIHCNNPNNVNIIGNTSFNTLNAISFMRWSWGSINNLKVKNNIFYPKYSNQRNLSYTNGGLNDPAVTTVQSALQSLGDIDSNYHASINEVGFNTDIYSTAGGPSIPTSPQSLDSWQILSANDLHSKRPFREAPQYSIRSVTGSNLFTNGPFTSNISGLTFFGSTVNATWDNTGAISGGSIKVEFKSPSPNKYVLLYSSIGAISASKNYVLRFTTVGTTGNGITRAYIRKTASPYSSLTPIQINSFGTAARVHEFLFTAPATDANGSFVIEIEQNSGTTYIDNIGFYEADAEVYNADDYLRIEYNATTSAKTIALGANYIGVDTTYYPGTITLQPFTSKILVKDTSILRQALAVKSSATAINCYGSTSTVTVTATGGIPPYKGAGIFSVPAGTYTYTVKDLTGASVSTTINITQPAAALKATATAGIINIFGAPTSVVVSATGGTAPYTGTGTITNVVAGNYTYSIKDAKGCAASVAITITQPLLLKATASAPAIGCYGGTSTVTVSATGGIAPYTGTGVFIVNAGSYSYTVKDAAGIANTLSITVTQPLAALKAVATAGSISIFGGTSSVSITASGGTAPYTGTGTVSNVAAGIYSYTVTDAKGCSASTTIKINQPLAAANISAKINCFGSSTTVNLAGVGGVAPYTGTGTYSVAAGKGSLKISFPTVITGTYTGLYYPIGPITAAKNYVLRISTLGTTAAGNLRVALRQTNTPYALLTARQSSIFGTSRVDHEFNFTAPATEAAANFLIEINQNSGTTYIDNIAFFEAGTSNNLTGNNLYSTDNFESGTSTIFNYSNNNNQLIAWDTSSKISGTYYYLIKDSTGSTVTSVVKTSQPAAPLLIGVSAGTISSFGGTTTVTVTAAGGTSPYAGTGAFSNINAGNYIYKITDANGCTSSKTIIIIQPASRPVNGQSTTLSSTAISNTLLTAVVYPNPSGAAFNLQVSGGSSEKLAVTVSTVDGKLLYAATGNSNHNYLFGESFATGLYLVKVIQGNTIKIMKVVKVK